MTVTLTVPAVSCTVPHWALCKIFYKMWLSVTPQAAITPLQGKHKAWEAEQAAMVPSRKMMLGGELEPDPKRCWLLTLLSLDAGTFQNMECNTQTSGLTS